MLARLNPSTTARCISAPRVAVVRVPRLQRTLMVKAGDQEGKSADDSGLESSFLKELQRRGLSADSLDDAPAGEKTSSSPPPPPGASAGTNPFASTSGASQGQGAQTRTRPRAPPPPVAEGQRERSMEMVNEGLEGLIPRASQLLTLGFSAFLPFLPFMLAFSLLFSAIFFVFGDSFLHGGREGVGLPAYVDPQTLLSEPTVDPYVPYSAPRP